MKQFFALVAVAVVVLGFAASASGQRSLHLTLQSPPGEWIGGGQTVDTIYTDTNTAFFSVALANRGGAGLPNYLTINVMQLPISTRYLLAQFGTDQLGHELREGTYLNAERAPFAGPGHAGLDISFEHRGCNTLTGSFVIHAIDYHAAGTDWVLDHFDASFVQHCEGGPLALTGTITYSIPEPAGAAALAWGALLLVRRRRDSH
jgi:hypothetical protein